MESNNKLSSTQIIGLVIGGVVLLGLGVLIGYLIADDSDHDMSNMMGSSQTSRTLGSVTDEASATRHNKADAEFAQMMVPHHQQALEMADLASTRASSAEVKSLAAEIKAAQQPEIDKMNAWLKIWGVAIGGSSMEGMGHGDGTGEGMMSEGDMSSLEGESGTAFDSDFLTMMIRHHQGAITMAGYELDKGQNAQALALAASIQITQQAEIDQMRALLE